MYIRYIFKKIFALEKLLSELWRVVDNFLKVGTIKGVMCNYFLDFRSINILTYTLGSGFLICKIKLPARQWDGHHMSA